MLEMLLGNKPAKGPDDSPLMNNWLRLADGTLGGPGGAIASANGKIYVLAIGGDYSKIARCYDIASNTWSSIADLPVAVTLGAAAVIGDKLYYHGGLVNEVYTRSLYCYDIPTNTWSTKATGVVSSTGHSMAAVNGKLYVGSGRGNNSNGGGYSTLRRYDPETNTWANLAVSTGIRHFSPMTAIGSKIYMHGGQYEEPVSGTWVNKPVMNVFVYDVETGEISFIPLPVNSGQAEHAVVSMGHYLYTIGGRFNGTPFSQRTARFSTKTEQWLLLRNRPIPSQPILAVVEGGEIYTYSGTGPDNQLWKYTP